ncbi:Mab-21 domain-containing protein [Aphelenchoides bicaudatus]|nr:Mab-21 domain-containing protein [Aphelenchoides bicaudatus]
MLGHSQISFQQVNNFVHEKVNQRSADIQKSIHAVVKLIQEILKDVEIQEPRFIPTLMESNGRYEGFRVLSPDEYEVEFITASGYLSARKIRSRFQALIGQTLEKPQFRDKCKLMPDSNDVKIRLYDKFVVQVVCAFRCNGIWPRSASHWPGPSIAWPSPELVKEVRYEGFDLLMPTQSASAASTSQNKQQNPASSMEGDAWAISMANAEDILLGNHTTNRHKTYTILKTLRDRHLNFNGSPINNYIIKTLVLYECEKHSSDHEWQDFCLGDRVIGVLLQLVSCLQCRKCPHYFLSNLDLFRGKSPQLLEHSSKVTWNLVRNLLLCDRALENL